MTSSRLTATVLAAISLTACLSATAQPCSSSDHALLDILSRRDDFVGYVCPNSRQECGMEQLSQKIEVTPIQLSPKPRGISGRIEDENVCVVSVIKKGKQFPTLIFKADSISTELIAEDWDSGLRVIRKLRNGKFVLEGRAMPDPGELEIYRLEWRGTSYDEYSRKCYRLHPGKGSGADKLIPVACQ